MGAPSGHFGLVSVTGTINFARARASSRNTAHMVYVSYSVPEQAQAARVRAMLAYTALSIDEVAQRTTGLSAATLRRIAAVSNPRGASIDELWAIADALNVPRGWLVNNWPDCCLIDEQTGAAVKAWKAKEMRFGVGNAEQRLHALEEGMRVLLAAEQRRRPDDNNERESARKRARPAREQTS